MRKAFWMVACTLFGCFYACDDNTSTLGVESIPDADVISINTQTFSVSARTLALDSVLARTKYCYLGNYTDEETGTNVHADFIMQFHQVEGYKLNDAIKGDTVTAMNVKLFFDSYTGDSLAPCRVSLYPLTKSLDNNKQPYTNIDPSDYYDESAGPLVTKTFTLTDRQLSDGDRTSSDYYTNINFTLPKEIGNDILKKFKEHPEYFADSKTFEEHVNKGYYVKFERGEGVMANIYVSQLNATYQYYMDSRVGTKDSLVTTTASFAATQEVVQANRITNSNLEKYIEDAQYTYLKTPSGLITELTLPVEEIAHYSDSINSAKLTLNCLHSTLAKNALSPPEDVLMVRKDSATLFFENYYIPNEYTSFLATYSENIKNTYQFTNIGYMLNEIRKDYLEGIKKDPDWKLKNPNWNKVVLIPVTTTYDSNGNISMVDHDLSLRYVKIKADDIDLQVIFTKFNK